MEFAGILNAISTQGVVKCTNRKPSFEIAPTTLVTFLWTVNFVLAVTYSQFPIQVCFTVTLS